jgi:FLVCR family MFS transporter 7
MSSRGAKFQNLPQGHHFMSKRHLLDSPSSNDNEIYEAECYRFVIMFLLFVVNIAVQCLWISFAPISDQAASYYSVSETFINTLSTIYMILYIPGTILAGWLLGKLGLYWSFLLGCSLMTIQGGMRILTIGDEHHARDYGEIILMASQIIGAMTQPLVLNSTPRVATI